MRLQILTFRTLADHAAFEGAAAPESQETPDGRGLLTRGQTMTGQDLPQVQIDLHIHLPENKTSRDYQAIIQDIAKYIYGKGFDSH